MRLSEQREKEIRECLGCTDYHREELLAEIDALRALLDLYDTTENIEIKNLSDELNKVLCR